MPPQLVQLAWGRDGCIILHFPFKMLHFSATPALAERETVWSGDALTGALLQCGILRAATALCMQHVGPGSAGAAMVLCIHAAPAALGPAAPAFGQASWETLPVSTSGLRRSGAASSPWLFFIDL